MESLKRGHHLLSSSDNDEEENNKRSCLASSDPLEWIPGQVFVQVLLNTQFDLSTTAWVFARVCHRWKDTILCYLTERWKAPDAYHPFSWTSRPEQGAGLVPPMEPLLGEWGHHGWLRLLKWAHGLDFPLLHEDDRERYGRHTLLAAACGGGHQPVVTWILDDLGGYLDEEKAIEGACRSGNDALLRWLIEERHVDPFIYIPSGENPASRGNLETCQWLVQHCRNHWWLTAAGRNNHRHILEWAISEGHADEAVWPLMLCLAHCPRAHHRPGVRRREGGWTRWSGCRRDWAAIRQPTSGRMPSGRQPGRASWQRWSGCSIGAARAHTSPYSKQPGVGTSMWWPSCGSVLASTSPSMPIWPRGQPSLDRFPCYSGWWTTGCP